MQIKRGSNRLVIILPSIGIVIKFPRIYLGKALNLLDQCITYGDRRWFKRQWEWPVELLPGFKGLLFQGLVANWNEFRFYRNSRNLFLEPTYFSLLGLCNIQRLSQSCTFSRGKKENRKSKLTRCLTRTPFSIYLWEHKPSPLGEPFRLVYHVTMKLYRQGPHTVFDLKYHLVWTTKYRKPILEGSLGRRMRDLIREICDTHSIQIIRGHISKEHVHIFISMPPQISVSKIMQYIKGKTSRKILQEYPSLNKRFWGKHFWSRGYFATTSGAITDEMIMYYIEHQDEDADKRGDDFTILDA